ncbi:MAG TPA: Ig-like domain-containing protein [Verrucomicrobiae bacterium]|jgi:hypothetical protein|nr:Ig-like domain-containing protein [Verrucomicrobiae bacterium]
MKSKNAFVPCLALSAMLFGGFSTTVQALPMIPAGVPFVTVQATDPLATEPGGDPGMFTICRSGNTNSAVTVSFSLAGTATNGVDYGALPLTVTLAAGQVSSNLVVAPASEPSATGYKTVVLNLERHGRNFTVASLDHATIYIVYKYTNVPPAVSIVTPTNGTSFLSLPNIEIAANASDSNGWVTSVEFFANGTAIGTVSNNNPFSGGPARPFTLRESHGSIEPIVGSSVNRYQFVWTNVTPGSYNLTAVATDNAGLQSTSRTVAIDVTTNLPDPKVRFINPVDGAEFPDRAAINLYAAAGEVGGVVQTVEFLANGTTLGVVTNYLAAEPASQFHLRMQWLPYYFPWTNAPVGSNVLTAVATDNNGTTAISTPVTVVVTTNLYQRRHGWGW